MYPSLLLFSQTKTQKGEKETTLLIDHQLLNTHEDTMLIFVQPFFSSSVISNCRLWRIMTQ